MFNLIADHSFDTCPTLDVLLLPGGIGTLNQIYDARHLGFLKKCAERAKIIASVCTGSAALAAAGLLDGKKATTNKASWALFTSLPSSSKAEWIRDARYVCDGSIMTSSGVSAGVDMAFHIAKELFGEVAATATAKEIHYTPMPAGDDPFAKLYLPTPNGGLATGLKDLIGWVRIAGLPYLHSSIVSSELSRQASPTIKEGWFGGSVKPIVVILIPDDGFELLDLGTAGEVFAISPSNALKVEYIGISSSGRSEVQDLVGGDGAVKLRASAVISTAEELFQKHAAPACIIALGSEKGAASKCIGVLKDVISRAKGAEVAPHLIAAGESGKAASVGVSGVEVTDSGMPVATACLKILGEMKGRDLAKTAARYAELAVDYLSMEE
ncbi:hypothetical protein HDU67_001558 [Dinochytrium kinnereticum]|nr:hypothetical protein HDU67_001558 [Dinochytrium kinnereticum]